MYLGATVLGRSPAVMRSAPEDWRYWKSPTNRPVSNETVNNKPSLSLLCLKEILDKNGALCNEQEGDNFTPRQPTAYSDIPSDDRKNNDQVPAEGIPDDE